MLQPIEQLLEDGELLSLANSGDLEAKNELYNRHSIWLKKWVTSIAHRYSIQDEHTINDLAQDTWLKIIKALEGGKWDADRGFQRLAFTFIRQAVHELISKKWRRNEESLDMMEFDNPVGYNELLLDMSLNMDNLIEICAEIDQTEYLFKKVVLLIKNRLSPPHQSIIIRHYLHGESLADISRGEVSQRGGDPYEAVRRRISAARKRLRDLLEDEFKNTADPFSLL